ncbi:MAG TPA: ATP-binding protein [Clostridiales bacterium]|nr:ATP-binding protein [Clostridiales bacterium]
MYDLISKLTLYRNYNNSYLDNISDIITEFENVNRSDNNKINNFIYDLLNFASELGLSGNIWNNYLAYLIIISENPFSLQCEKRNGINGSIKHFALSDLKIIFKLINYKFENIRILSKDSNFNYLFHFEAENNKKIHNKNLSNKIMKLSKQIRIAKDENELYDIVTEFYYKNGLGEFGFSKAFRVKTIDNVIELSPIINTDDVVLSDLVGYEIQKKKLDDNTKAFIEGKEANNVLLFGDSGTGKSTSVKAILNKYYDQGLRIIEIYKHQFEYLSQVINLVKNRNYKFIIYMDDLSFEEYEIEYKYLKAVIEGGIEIKPGNVLIYATSNRRHIIRETWTDRKDMEVVDDLHRSDTMEEKLSLVERFGVTINFSSPSMNEFNSIVCNLAKRYKNINLTEEELIAKANIWELSHGGKSGRTAQQFINYLAGTYASDENNVSL